MYFISFIIDFCSACSCGVPGALEKADPDGDVGRARLLQPHNHKA